MSVYPNVAESIWRYSDRSLTQAKFPFWSAIISQASNSVSVPALSWVYVNIRPGPNETWLVWIDAHTVSTSGDVRYVATDGTVEYCHVMCYTTNESPRIGVMKILNFGLWGRIKAYNPNSSTSIDLNYGYSGFKLSQPLWSPKRLDNPELKPWKRPKTKPLPNAISALDKYAFDILGIDPAKPNEYGLGVILEEDTSLTIDPATGFPVERLTVYVKADVLADLIAKFKAGTADPITTGYAKYIKKWKAEGIDIGV
ncbi:MAG: hypothetical protein QXS32_09045 [Candidatus Nezhaarchaeales archaeon]